MTGRGGGVKSVLVVMFFVVDVWIVIWVLWVGGMEMGFERALGAFCYVLPLNLLIEERICRFSGMMVFGAVGEDTYFEIYCGGF